MRCLIFIMIGLFAPTIALAGDAVPQASGYKILAPKKANPTSPGSVEEAKEIATAYLAHTAIKFDSVQLGENGDTATIASAVGDKPCTLTLKRTDYGRKPFLLPQHNVEYFGWEVNSSSCVSK